MKKKKIVVIYATYGSGHKAIANYIDSYISSVDKNYEILKIDLLDYAMPYLGKMSKVANEFLMLRVPTMWSALYQSSNYDISGKISLKIQMNLFKNKNLQKLITDFNPDIAICTHFFGGELIKKYEKKGLIKTNIVTIITDYDPHTFWTSHPRKQDYYIVGAEPLKKQLMQCNICEDHIYATGIPINPVVTDSFDVIKFKTKYHFDNDKLTCIFFGGGGNGSMASIPYLRTIIRSKLDMNIVFIAGKNEKCYKKAQTMVKNSGMKNINVIGYATNVPELLQIADFVITKPGGVQTTECMYYKKPMVLFNSSGGQENANYRFLVDKGYAKMFRTHFFFGLFLMKIYHNPDLILSMQDNFKSSTAQESMEHVYQLLEKIYQENAK